MLIINTLHKYRLYLYILLFSFTFIFSSLDKFQFLGDVSDKLQILQHSEISFDNYEKYQFIRNHIDKINLNCGDTPYVHCGQWFRVRASSFLNYLYTSKIYFLFDSSIKSKNNLNDSDNIIDLEFIEISKIYNYSIIFSYLIILLLFILFIYKLDKLSSFFIFIFLFSILITNNHLLNFNLYYFSEFFHKNPKWGTLTELEPKGILVFFILASLIFYINSSYKLFFISIILMIFIHWGQALFVQLFFVLAFALKLFCDLIFDNKLYIKNFLIAFIIFVSSYFLINLTYVSENRVDSFLLELINYFVSRNFIFMNFFRIIFYTIIISFTFYIIFKIKKSTKSNIEIYLVNYLILGVCSLIFLEFLFYLHQFNNQFSENEFSLIYDRVLGNLYFLEFIFLFSLILIIIYRYSVFFNDLFFDKKLDLKLSYIFTTFIFLLFFEFVINANSINGLKQNYENSKILTNKFSISYFQKIKYKIQNIPYEFFFSICGENRINFDKNVINHCKEKQNYKLIKKYLNLDNELLSNEIKNFNIDTKRPYVYIIQLNSWYKE